MDMAQYTHKYNEQEREMISSSCSMLDLPFNNSGSIVFINLGLTAASTATTAAGRATAA